MGPKSKKQETKQQDKVIEDKTFGLKNKKGAKTQKYVQQVAQQVRFGNVSKAKADRMAEPSRKDKKEAERQKLEELKELFKPVVAASKTDGVDPKSVICSYFKQGLCTKGAKCKFSHDMTSAAALGERKSEKKNLYEDSREDSMENWDEDELRKVIEKKHGEIEKTKPKTDIVCKYFLDAVEKKKYGWFWECPNGNDKCHYKHALPPGFVLKSDKKSKKDEGNRLSLEDLIERERALLPANQTKITLESFNAWKERKKMEKVKALEESSSKKQKEYHAGKLVGLSGRDLFSFNPELAQDDENDEDAGEVVMYERDSDDEVEQDAAFHAAEAVEEEKRRERLRELRKEDSADPNAEQLTNKLNEIDIDS